MTDAKQLIAETTRCLKLIDFLCARLGHLAAAQLQRRLQAEVGGLAGRSLVERWFRPGAWSDWASHIGSATGEALNPDDFVRSLAGDNL